MAQDRWAIAQRVIAIKAASGLIDMFAASSW
jgi:hypothetical protein